MKVCTQSMALWIGEFKAEKHMAEPANHLCTWAFQRWHNTNHPTPVQRKWCTQPGQVTTRERTSVKILQRPAAVPYVLLNLTTRLGWCNLHNTPSIRPHCTVAIQLRRSGISTGYNNRIFSITDWTTMTENLSTYQIKCIRRVILKKQQQCFTMRISHKTIKTQKHKKEKQQDLPCDSSWILGPPEAICGWTWDLTV